MQTDPRDKIKYDHQDPDKLFPPEERPQTLGERLARAFGGGAKEEEAPLQPGGEPVPLPEELPAEQPPSPDIEVPLSPEDEHGWSTEQINALLAERGIPVGEIRPAALPEFNGSGDQGILAGGVTAAEAFEIFKRYYDTDDHKAIGTEVSRISPAQVGGRKVWLPDLTGRDAARKEWRNKAVHLQKEVEHLREVATSLKSERDDYAGQLGGARMALRRVMFDFLEPKHAGRDGYRKLLLREHNIEERHVADEEKAASEDILDWVKAWASVDARVEKVRKARKARAKPKAKAKPAPKARRKKPQSKRGR